MSFVLGIDGGTESIRAGIFDRAGRLLASQASPYPTTYPQPSWAEQEPGSWWSSLSLAVSGAMQASGMNERAHSLNSNENPRFQKVSKAIRSLRCALTPRAAPSSRWTRVGCWLSCSDSSDTLSSIAEGNALRPALLWMVNLLPPFELCCG